MTTFVQYRAAYETERARLEETFARMSLQEKTRRVLGRDNPLLYSSRTVADTLGDRRLPDSAVTRDLDRQTAQFESIAHHTLRLVPLRPLQVQDSRWMYLD